MTKEETSTKFQAVEGDISALQRAVNQTNQELNQALSLLGQVRQELLLEQSHVKRLQLEMEKVYTYINEKQFR